MADIANWSTTAALNVLSSGTAGTGGINTAEGSARSDVNNTMRDFMARIKAWQTTGVFTTITTVDNTLARYDGTSGKLQASSVIVDDNGNVTIASTDAGAGGAPILTLFRDSASPAAADVLGQLAFTGRDSGGNVQDYIYIYGRLDDATAGSEDASIIYTTFINGVLTAVATAGATGWNSMNIGATTAGTLRATTITYTTSLTLLAGTAPTAEGSMQWNTATDAILVGDGAATKTFRANSWETISETAISAAASWATTGLSAWRMLRAYGWAIPVTDGVNAIVRTDANGGASYDAGASDYGLVGTKSIGGTSSGVGQTTTGFVLNNTNTIGNVAPEGIWFEITFHEFNQARRCFVEFTASWIDGSGVFCQQTIGGFRDDANARDAIQFIFSSGNIATGYITLEGVRG